MPAVLPLSAKAFSPFGEVIDTKRGFPTLINQEYTEKYADLAQVDVEQLGGELSVCIYRSNPVDLPFIVKQMERHPISSQMFVPLNDNPYLVVVAPPGDLDERAIQVFLANEDQGVNYRAGVWHHFNLALLETSNFLVLERKGPEPNCDEHLLKEPFVIRLKDLPL